MSWEAAANDTATSLYYEGDLLPPSLMIPFDVLVAISSTLSMIGSACIIFMARRELNKIMHRLLFALSISDFMYSGASLIQPYLVPSDLNLVGASGTAATCSVVGFIWIFAWLLGCIYSSYLSLYFLATVRYNWKEEPPQKFIYCSILQGWEISLHIGSLLLASVVPILAVATQLINPHDFFYICFIDPLPWGCEEDPGLEKVPCQRGTRLAFNVAGAILSILLAIFVSISFLAAFLTYCTVRTKLSKTKRFDFERGISLGHTTSSNGRRRSSNFHHDKRLQEVATQAVLYAMVYFNTWFWYGLGTALDWMYTVDQSIQGASAPGFYTLRIMTASLAPLQVRMIMFRRAFRLLIVKLNDALLFL